MYKCTAYYVICNITLHVWASSNFRAEFLGCSPKSPLFEYKTDIILRNRHCHRYITFTVVYFTFCFRKKIFFQSSTIQFGFFWKHFLRFFDFFQNQPQIFPRAEILSDKSSILPIAMKVGSKDAGDSPASFALLFVKNYAILDLSDKISARGGGFQNWTTLIILVRVSVYWINSCNQQTCSVFYVQKRGRYLG